MNIKIHEYLVKGFVDGELIINKVVSTLLFEDDAKRMAYFIFDTSVPCNLLSFDDITFDVYRLN